MKIKKEINIFGFLKFFFRKYISKFNSFSDNKFIDPVAIVNTYPKYDQFIKINLS